MISITLLSLSRLQINVQVQQEKEEKENERINATQVTVGKSLILKIPNTRRLIDLRGGGGGEGGGKNSRSSRDENLLNLREAEEKENRIHEQRAGYGIFRGEFFDSSNSYGQLGCACYAVREFSRPLNHENIPRSRGFAPRSRQKYYLPELFAR